MKKMSDVPMSSSLSKGVSHVWVCGVERGQAWGRAEAKKWLVGNGVVDFQHESREE
jgi:hypothetical protein